MTRLELDTIGEANRAFWYPGLVAKPPAKTRPKEEKPVDDSTFAIVDRSHHGDDEVDMDTHKPNHRPKFWRGVPRKKGRR